MVKEIDINTWKRKEHYEFFSQFEEPFFGVTIHIDCTKAYHLCKTSNISFFQYYLYQSIKAVNSVEAFKYRIVDEKVFLYDIIHASATINRPDGTFAFSYIPYAKDFETFKLNTETEIQRIQNSSQLFPPVNPPNTVHYSSLPWLKFTSISHARFFASKDSCPKISFGKITKENNICLMPVSIHVHHALVDGSDVGSYVDKFQELMDEL